MIQIYINVEVYVVTEVIVPKVATVKRLLLG